MVAAGYLVVVIAEAKFTRFNVQGCCEVPSKGPKRRSEGATSALQNPFLDHESTLMLNTQRLCIYYSG